MSKAIEPMTKTNGISHAIETAVSAAAQATNSVKGTFAHFWHQKEHDIYRRLGYTEAHIDWIRNYLEHTFQNQKDSVKGRADEAAIALKRYLDSCKVQTPNQVDVNVHRMKRYLEAWRTLVE
jgi:tRNA U34 5-carboxymethylaminomethyl modifying GTPase MnmE/TrmE